MNDYIVYFSLTLGFSALFSMGGVGQVKKLIGVVTYQLATKIKSNQRRKP